MRVLITGATGFVGLHLSRWLSARGHQVSGTWLIKDPSQHISGVKMYQCDFRDPAQITRLIKKVLPQRIFHLAALSSVRDSFENPMAVYETNFLGTYHLLESMRTAAPKARILVVGSSQMYGDASEVMSEKCALQPNSPYAVSKAAADLLAYQHFRKYEMHVIRARPFNHTGPGQPPSFVCSDFGRQAAAIHLGLQKPVLSVGNLKVERDFTDVRDVIRAYDSLLEKGTPGEAYNVCSGHLTSLKTIVACLSGLSGRKIEVRVAAARLRDRETLKLRGNNRKLTRATGWKCQYNIRTTLKDIYDYWLSSLGRNGLRGESSA